MTAPFKMRAEPWMDRAACLGDDLDAAFPTCVREAREFIHRNCDRCPVLEECGTFAAKFKMEYGIWSGKVLGKDAGHPVVGE